MKGHSIPVMADRASQASTIGKAMEGGGVKPLYWHMVTNTIPISVMIPKTTNCGLSVRGLKRRSIKVTASTMAKTTRKVRQDVVLDSIVMMVARIAQVAIQITTMVCVFMVVGSGVGYRALATVRIVLQAYGERTHSSPYATDSRNRLLVQPYGFLVSRSVSLTRLSTR